MTEIELLREAARLMRERATTATPAPWKVTDNRSIEAPTGFRGRVVASVGAYESGWPSTADAQHIASWHPDVAGAVADWLDEDARHLEEHIPAWTAPSRGVDDPPAVAWNNPEALAALIEHHHGRALAVARAYLGVES